MVKTLIGLSAITLLASFVGCGDDTDPVPDPGKGGTEITSIPGRPDLVFLQPPINSPLINGSSIVHSFEVPEQTLSIGVTVIGIPEQSYWVCEWRDGQDQLVVNNDWHLGSQGSTRCVDCPNPVPREDHVMAALFPSGPGMVPTAGTHKVRICGQGIFENSNATVQLSILAKTGVVSDRAALDLNLYFSGSRGWTAESAPTDPEFTSILDDVRAIYDAAGVSLGTISWNNLPTGFQSVSNDKLDELFLSIGDEPNFAVNVFLVDEINGGELLGKSGGVPGAFKSKSARSGVAIATSMSMLELPIVVAHEVGHYLGFWHTQEGLDTLPQDPFPDTIEDDQSFLMHWSPLGNTFSPEQKKVLLRNPYLRTP